MLHPENPVRCVRLTHAFVHVLPLRRHDPILSELRLCTRWSHPNRLTLGRFASSRSNLVTAGSHQIRCLPTASATPREGVSFRVLGRSVPVPGHILLLIVPFLWGSYSVCIKFLSHLPWSLNPIFFNVLRLTTGALCVLPTLYDFLFRRRQKLSSPVLVAGFELGFWTLLTNILQISGLKYINASRSAFLTQLCTVIVPFVSFASGLESHIPRRIWAACFISVFGVGLLSLDGTSSAFSINGDLFLLASAFASAIYVIRAKQHSGLGNAPVLTAAKVFGQLVFSLIHISVVFGRKTQFSALPTMVSAAFVGSTPWLLALHVLLVLYNGILLCWAATALQLRGQKMVSASEAVVIFSTTPLWATALAIPLGERFGLRGIIGACLIMFATLMTTATDRSDRHRGVSVSKNGIE